VLIALITGYCFLAYCVNVFFSLDKR